MSLSRLGLLVHKSGVKGRVTEGLEDTGLLVKLDSLVGVNTKSPAQNRGKP